MPESQDLTELKDIDHFIQAGFMALIAVTQQVRDGRDGPPSPADIRDAAELLRRCSACLMDSPLLVW